MKKFINVFLIVVLFQACSAVKEQSKQEKNTMEDQFIFEIVIINNVMPSPSPRKYMYAIIKLRPNQGKLKSNWKLVSFKLNQKRYNTFDYSQFKGRNSSEYSNIIREIPKSSKRPCKADVLIENEAGKQLEYSIENVPIQQVQ